MPERKSGGSTGEETVELEVWGNVEDTLTDDEPPMAVPQTVTVPKPSSGDHVAVVRTSPVVVSLGVLPTDDPDAYEHDLETHVVDGLRGKSEFWFSAAAIANADVVDVNTHGQDLESIDLEVEYRGWPARLKKRLREFKRKRRVNKAIARGR